MEALAYSVEDAARRAATSKSFIYQEIAAGRLVARRRGRGLVLLHSELDAWLRALPPAHARERAA